MKTRDYDKSDEAVYRGKLVNGGTYEINAKYVVSVKCDPV